MLHVRTLSEAVRLVCSIGDRCRSATASAASTTDNGLPEDGPADAELLDALGGLLAEPLISPADVPPFDRSQVDGFAVHAEDTFGAGESLPAMLSCTGEVLMGHDAGPALLRGTCRAVPTGGQLPAGADAVIMIEDVEDHGDGFRYLNRSVSPGAHVLYRGDDVRTGQTLMPAGTRLLPQDLAAAAALGLTRLRVSKVVPIAIRSGLTVGILSTGDELAPAGRPLAAGQVYDINATMLAALLRQAGFASQSFGILPDQYGRITGAMQSALAACQAVVITGGSSVGDRDHVAAAIAASGSPGVLLHGIAVKPGKPTLIGLCGDVPVLGLPGHPLAAWFMARQLMLPLLYRMAGLAEPGEPVIRARLIRQVPSAPGREELLPVRISPAAPIARSAPANSRQPGIAWLAEPVMAKSGLITLLCHAQGYIRIPRDCEGLPADSEVAVHIMRGDGDAF